jgi:chorismate synthase
MASSFGHLFRVTTFGESHGPALGVIVDGCPPRLPLEAADIQVELDRRRPGQSKLTTQRQEGDQIELLSGVHDGVTLGTPIGMIIRNTDQRSKDYAEMLDRYRPSHADYTTQQKYGVRDARGGGRSSARETAARVAAGAIARKWLAVDAGVDIVAWVDRVRDLEAQVDPVSVGRDAVEATPVRCPDAAMAPRMIEAIEAARKAGDSLGGVVGCVARGVPVGWGEPVFDRLEADLGKALLSLPACKGFESGSGFAGTRLFGSQHNDAFVPGADGKVHTRTNHSGGIQGGISNGEPVIVRAAFKPTATIMHAQDTVDVHGQATTITGRGRHDPCVLPRAVPIVEAMVALVLIDHALRQRALTGVL